MSGYGLPKDRFKLAFAWFGFGGVFLSFTLFGAVSASAGVGRPAWHAVFLATGLLGSLCILFGLMILALNMHHLWKGGKE